MLPEKLYMVFDRRMLKEARNAKNLTVQIECLLILHVELKHGERVATQ